MTGTISFSDFQKLDIRVGTVIEAAVVLGYEEYLRMKQIRRKQTTVKLEQMLNEIHAKNVHIPAADYYPRKLQTHIRPKSDRSD